MVKDNPAISRRQFMRILAVGGGASLVLGSGLGLTGCGGAADVSETRLLMGTIVNLRVIGGDEPSAREALGAALGHMQELEAILSRFRSDSQVSQLNASGELVGPHAVLYQVLDQAMEISRLSEGAFDVTVKPVLDVYFATQRDGKGLPNDRELGQALKLVGYQGLELTSELIRLAEPGMAITLDGIAKGTIVDAAVRTLRAKGFFNVLVDAGGDLLGSGERGPQQAWEIGLQSPRQRNALLGRFGVIDQAAATSGDYMQAFDADFRHHHITDPRTGVSSPELASATVVAPTAALADALATTVMVMGVEAGTDLLARQVGCQGLMVTKAMQEIQTAGFIGLQS
jgi:thiamine biosynthesis lipoprotein